MKAKPTYLLIDFYFKTASVDQCCVLFLLDVPEILRFFPSEKFF